MQQPAPRKVFIGAALIAALFLLIQFVPVDRSNPPVGVDLIAPAGVKEIFRRSCYDCHSHETRWPWYSRLAPASWWLAKHVEEGRADLNFSQWPLFDMEARGHLMRDIEKQLTDGTMPPRSYTFGHREARLSDQDLQVLLEWARQGY